MRQITFYPAPGADAFETTLYLDSDYRLWPRLSEAIGRDIEVCPDDLHGLECFWGGEYDEDHTAEIVYATAPNGVREIIGSIDRKLTTDEWREIRRVFPKELTRAA